MIGLYAVNAYTVARRTREIGIRMALGADGSATLKMILREGLTVTAVGVGVGTLLAIAVGQVLAGVLYDIHSFDPLVLWLAPVVLRWLRLQPVTSRREERRTWTRWCTPLRVINVSLEI